MDTDVVNLHHLRENTRRVRITGKCTTDGHIENDEEWMIKYPLSAGWKIRGTTRSVKHSVDVKTDHIGLPLDGEDMEIVG